MGKFINLHIFAHYSVFKADLSCLCAKLGATCAKLPYTDVIPIVEMTDISGGRSNRITERYNIGHNRVQVKILGCIHLGNANLL